MIGVAMPPTVAMTGKALLWHYRVILRLIIVVDSHGRLGSHQVQTLPCLQASRHRQA